MLSDLSEQHITTMMSIRADPCYWAELLFGISVNYTDPWGKPRVYENQKKLIETPFRLRPECQGASAVGSGHQTSKTESIRVLAILWLISHYPAYVILLGDTWPAVTNKLLPGIKARVLSANQRIQKALKGKLPDEMLRQLYYFDPKNLPDKTQWELGPEWGVYGFAPQNPEPLQGYHSHGKYGGTFVAGDEANAIPIEFVEPLKVYSKNPRNYVLLPGNPTSQDSSFSCILRKEVGYEGWDVFNLSSWDTPNAMSTRELIERGELTIEEALSGKEFIADGFEGLATYSYCYEQQRKHPNIYHPRVLGLPPDQSDDTWISRRTITECGQRGVNGVLPGKREILLCDPAFSDDGDDAVVLIVDTERDCLTYNEARRRHDEMKMAGWIMGLCLERPGIFEIRIEGDGIGNPLGKRLQRILDGDGSEENEELRSLRKRLAERGRIPAIDIIRSADNAHDAVSNANRKAENWRRMKDGLQTFAISPEWIDDFYEISKMKYLEPPNGKLQMEPKKEFKKRGNPSPGHADALALYYARPVGDALFQVLERTHKDLLMKAEPAVEMAEGKVANIYFKALGPTVFPRKGKLARAWWYSRRTLTGVVWVHVDAKQVWTVIDAETYKDVHLEEIARRVFERSVDAKGKPMEFAYDICGALEGVAKVSADEFYDQTIDRALRACARAKNLPSVSTPFPIPPAQMGGLAGLDKLDSLIDGNGKRDCDVLTIWPSNVAEDLKRARFRQPSSSADPEEDQTQEAVAGGGPLVRALRLLAVHSIRG